MTEEIKKCQRGLVVPEGSGIKKCGDCDFFECCDHQAYIDQLIEEDRHKLRRHREGGLRRSSDLTLILEK